MQCRHCGKNPATTHIKRIVNGELSEIALCSDCARKLGCGGLFGDWSLAGLLGSLLEEEPQRSEEIRCSGCGCTFDEIARTGQVGCAQCYQTFRRRLSSMIQRLHGNTIHRGKSPIKAELTVRPQSGLQVVAPEKHSLLEEKEKQLRKAVEEQNYELAVVLRDEIKALKGED